MSSSTAIFEVLVRDVSAARGGRAERHEGGGERAVGGAMMLVEVSHEGAGLPVAKAPSNEVSAEACRFSENHDEREWTDAEHRSARFATRGVAVCLL